MRTILLMLTINRGKMTNFMYFSMKAISYSPYIFPSILTYIRTLKHSMLHFELYCLYILLLSLEDLMRPDREWVYRLIDRPRYILTLNSWLELSHLLNMLVINQYLWIVLKYGALVINISTESFF